MTQNRSTTHEAYDHSYVTFYQNKDGDYVFILFETDLGRAVAAKFDADQAKELVSNMRQVCDFVKGNPRSLDGPHPLVEGRDKTKVGLGVCVPGSHILINAVEESEHASRTRPNRRASASLTVGQMEHLASDILWEVDLGEGT